MTIIAEQSGIQPGSEVYAALMERTEIMTLSQAAHDAVVSPKQAGGISYAARAALGVRMARIHQDAGLTMHYQRLLDATLADPETARLGDPDEVFDDPRLKGIAAHVDLVTCSPRDAGPADIQRLKDVGVLEPDIVRLSELIAFVNYQVRVIAGLRLLGAKS
jgi:uncharacterized protein YciW